VRDPLKFRACFTGACPGELIPGNLILDHSPILSCFVTLVAATGSGTASAGASDANEPRDSLPIKFPK
jgi:hypothetical protein